MYVINQFILISQNILKIPSSTVVAFSLYLIVKFDETGKNNMGERVLFGGFFIVLFDYDLTYYL